MQYYFFTFTNRSPLKQHAVGICARSYGEARTAMCEVFYDLWAFQYGWFGSSGWEEQHSNYGLRLLMGIRVFNHGSIEHPSLENLFVEPAAFIAEAEKELS